MQQTEIRELIKYAQEVFGLELELIKSKEPMTFEKIFGVVDSEKDYDTAFGGVAFKGETLGDFINEYYPSINPATFDIDTLNKDLVECGIQPVGKCIDKEISR